MSRIIVTTHYNRPNHTRDLLDNLAACIGIEDYLVVFSVEPGCPEVIQLINEDTTLNKKIYVNDTLMGLWPHKHEALRRAFLEGDFVLHLEDDIRLSQDGLQYFNWCDEAFAGDKSVYTAHAHHPTTRKDFAIYQSMYEDPYHTVFTRSSAYSPWGWATWQDRWAEIEGRWTGEDRDLIYTFSNGRCGAYPAVSRSMHLGDDNGLVSHPEIYDTLARAGHRRGARSRLSGNADLLVQNSKGREWIKLDDSTVKSRAPRGDPEYGEFILDFWAGSFDVTDMPGDFHGVRL